MNLSAVVFWVWVVSTVITFYVEACEIARSLNHDERHLESTPGYVPTTTWFSVIWASVRVVCPVLNTIMAAVWLAEKMGQLVQRLDRPILKRKP